MLALTRSSQLELASKNSVKPAAKIGQEAAGLADLALSAGAGPIGLGIGALIETGQAMPELTSR